VGRALISLGFGSKDVTVLYDLNYAQFVAALSDFNSTLNPEDSAFFYFSGHGFSIDGENYVAPTDFIFGADKASARSASVALNQIVNHLNIARTRVIILDACRSPAPLLKKLENGAISGLVPPQGTGSLVGFSTSFGLAANARSLGGLSFYTQFLVDSLNNRPADMYSALEAAKAATTAASNAQQIPAIYDEMVGRFFLPNGGPEVAGCATGTYFEGDPQLSWVFVRSKDSFSGKRTDNACWTNLSRSGTTWVGTLVCSNNASYPVTLTPDADCSHIASSLTWFKLHR
jgi:hypothetical protein